MNKQNLHPAARKWLNWLFIFDLVALCATGLGAVTVAADGMAFLGIAQEESRTLIIVIRTVAVLVIIPWGLTKIFDLRGIVLEASRQLEEKNGSNGGEKP